MTAPLPRRKKPVVLIRLALYLCLLATVGAAAYMGYQVARAKSDLKETQDRLVSGLGITAAAPRHLAPEYSDKEGRLVADPPSDPATLLDPDPLVIGTIEDTEGDAPMVDWDGLGKSVSAATGKKVTLRKYNNSPDDVAAVKAGKIHVVALHAADTPYLVNNAGFVPVAVLGDESGAEGNRLDLAVPAASGIRALSDLKGHTLTCTTPASITGYRAAVAVLLQEAGMRPNVDYFVTFSLGQKRSVTGVAKGEYEAAALSDDKVRSMEKKDKVKASDFRVIYQSPVIPRLTVGYVYDLQPALAAKVRQAVLDFKNEKDEASGGASSDEGGGKPMRFTAVDYKKDFDFVRKIDASFDPRFNGKPPKAKSAAPASTAPSPATSEPTGE